VEFEALVMAFFAGAAWAHLTQRAWSERDPNFLYLIAGLFTVGSFCFWAFQYDHPLATALGIACFTVPFWVSAIAVARRKFSD
jgi:hypothetical protein